MGQSEYHYDGDGRMIDLRHEDGSAAVLRSATYTYAQGRLESARLDGGVPLTYSYDYLGQLTGAVQTGGGSESYSYDELGNRSGGEMGAGNRLLEDDTWQYTYDDAGQLVQKSRVVIVYDEECPMGCETLGETWTYTYDHRGQLVLAEQRDEPEGTLQTRVDYAYDVFGQRVERGVWTEASGVREIQHLAYDGGAVWADLDGGNDLVERRLYTDAVDSVFARVDSGGAAAWYLTDRLGSVTDLTDATGDVQDHKAYDSFGKLLSETNASFGDRYGWTGREYEAEAEQQYNRARYYEAGTGRWTSEDPIGFGGRDANLYRYVGNGPTNATDPSGLEADPENPSYWSIFWTSVGENTWNVGAGIRGGAKALVIDPAINGSKRFVNGLEQIRESPLGAAQRFGRMTYNGAQVLGERSKVAYGRFKDGLSQLRDPLAAGKKFGSMMGAGTEVLYDRYMEDPATNSGKIAFGLLAAAGTQAGANSVRARLDRCPAPAPVGTASAPGALVTIRGVQARELSRRLTATEMAALQRNTGKEAAQIYLTGPGRNGGGGTYYLIQGAQGNVSIPLRPNVRWINHTHPAFHPSGAPVPLTPSAADKNVLRLLELYGSPQRTSQIVPELGQPFLFQK